MFAQRLAYHNFFFGVGEDFAFLAGWNELVSITKLIHETFPELCVGNGRGGGGGVDGLCVSFDDNNHDGGGALAFGQ